MKTFISILLIVSLPLTSFSLDSLNLKLLNHVKKVDKTETDLNKIVNKLSSITKNDYEKVEIFCYWISENIDYDVIAYTTKNYITTRENILKRKKGVCQNYSELLEDMCKIVDIPCFLITGFAKGSALPDESKDYKKTNHAWNVVKVEGEYYHTDVTWASGSASFINNQMVYHRGINKQYILTQSTEFLSKHLPTSPKWQLNNKIITWDSFTKKDGYELMIKEKLWSENYNYVDTLEKYSQLDECEKRLSNTQSSYNFIPHFGNDRLIADSYVSAGNCLSNSIDKIKLNKRILKKAMKYYWKAYKVYDELYYEATTEKEEDEIDKKLTEIKSYIMYISYQFNIAPND